MFFQEDDISAAKTIHKIQELQRDRERLPYRLGLFVRQPKQHTSNCLFSPWH